MVEAALTRKAATPGVASGSPPVTEDAFLIDRQKFWSWFTGLIGKSAIAIAALLILLWYFLI